MKARKLYLSKAIRRSGFTLVELLVVIAIIGILATVVIVNVANARRRAADARVLSDLSEAAKVASLCMANDGVLINGATATAIILGAIPRTPVTTIQDATSVYSNICNPVSAAPGKWPQVGRRGSDGNNWAWVSSAVANPAASTFSFYAQTGAAAGNRRVYCDQNGCAKQDGTGNPASW